MAPNLHPRSKRDARQGYGLKKILVAAANNGMLYGLDSVTGNQMWKTQVPFFNYQLVKVSGYHAPSGNDKVNRSDDMVGFHIHDLLLFLARFALLSNYANL